MISDILRVFIPAVLVFIVGILITPELSGFMYAHKLWKRSARGNTKENPNIDAAFAAVHADDAETSTPRIGGVVIWLSLLITTLSIWILAIVFPNSVFFDLDFVSRSQTWVPLFCLLAASGIGLADDLLQIFGNGLAKVDGLGRYQRVAMVTLIGLVGALWFYTKLDIASIFIPFYGQLYLGVGFIILFVAAVLGTFSGGVIDGIDGLAGGVLATAFAAYATIAYFNGQVDIAALCAAITGGILAFLWFNVPPARFYLGETGMLGLSVTLAVVAFLTDAIIVLPIIALPLVVSSASSIIQMIARRVFHKKVFRVAPLHHHFQALGWSREKVTMRYWIIAIVVAIIGVSIHFVG